MIYVDNHIYIVHPIWRPKWHRVFITISRYITRYPVYNFADRYIADIRYLKHWYSITIIYHLPHYIAELIVIHRLRSPERELWQPKPDWVTQCNRILKIRVKPLTVSILLRRSLKDFILKVWNQDRGNFYSMEVLH